jgi:signal transduction histidine kinase
LSISVEAPDERLGLDPEAEEHLYRLSQEALHNVVKHAGASHVGIRLFTTADGNVVLEITDNGAGFDPASIPPGHMGLTTMADRARQIGGSLDVTSRLGEGATVRASVPGPTQAPSARERAGSAEIVA